MKVLYVTTIIGTIEAFLIPHIKLLTDLGHEVHIACNGACSISAELSKLINKAYDVEFKRSPFEKENFAAYVKLKNIISLEKYDLVHTHTPVASFLTRLACRNIPNTKILYTAHGFHFYKGAPLKNWIIYYAMERLVARWTDAIITINNEDFQRAKKMPIRKKGKAYLIPGIGVDIVKFKPISQQQKNALRKEYGFKEDDFLLIYAAELNHNKNQVFLINTIALLKERIPNIKLLLAGEGELKYEYISLVNSLNLNKEVIFLGFRKDLDKLIPMCDIGVSASRREGFGINVVEYLACGLPVVVSDNRGHREIVHNQVNGFLFEKENITQFIGIIEKLYKDIELRNRTGGVARHYSYDYGIEKSLAAMESIYREWNQCY